MSFPPYQPDQPIAAAAPAGHLPFAWTVLLYGCAGLLILVLLVIAGRTEISFGVFTQDPMTLAKGEPYFGLLSNIGILFWCASATLCFFVSGLIPEAAPSPARRFLIVSGLVTLVLLFDDLFQLHEAVLPQVLGLRQRHVLLAYLLLALFYLISYWQILLRRYRLSIVAALALFALSLGEDALALAPERWHYLLEDGAKLFGIISWFNYFVLVCREEVQRCIGKSSR